MVTPDRQAKSIGQEQTFGENLTSPEAVLAALLAHTEEVAFRLRRSRVRGRAVAVKIRSGAFKTITRRRTVAEASDLTADLWPIARALFNEWASTRFVPVRLIGVTVSDLQHADDQPLLFGHLLNDRRRHAETAMDTINARFGSRTISRAHDQQLGTRSSSAMLPRD